MPETKEPQGLVQYNVRYLHRISSDAMQAVVAELLVAPKPDVDELLVLRRFGSSEQQDQVLKLIEKHPPRSVGRHATKLADNAGGGTEDGRVEEMIAGRGRGRE